MFRIFFRRRRVAGLLVARGMSEFPQFDGGVQMMNVRVRRYIDNTRIAKKQKNRS
jgi:hypothetical protein